MHSLEKDTKRIDGHKRRATRKLAVDYGVTRHPVSLAGFLACTAIIVIVSFDVGYVSCGCRSFNVGLRVVGTRSASAYPRHRCGCLAGE